MPTTSRERYESSVGRIRELIAAGETYQVNHTMRLRSRVEGDPRGLYRDLCYAQRGALLGLPRSRPVPRALRLAGAVLRAPRRRDRDPADEGHRAARPVAGGGSRRRGAPPRLGEGSRRERDDRGPPAQRSRTDQPDRFGHLGRRLPGRALRDRLAADDDRVGGARSRGRSVGRVPRVVPERIDHRRAEGPDDGDHPRARGLASRDLLRRRRLPGAGGIRPAGRSFQRGDPDRHGGHRLDDGRVRRRRRHHVGFRRRHEYEETVAKARVLTARRPGFELLETMRLDPAEASGTSSATSSGSPTPPTTSGSDTTRRRFARRSRRPSRPRRPRRCRVRLALRKDGTVRVVTTPLASEPDVAPRRDRRRSPRILETSSCSTRRRAASGTRRRGAGTPTPTTCCSSTIAARSRNRRSRTWRCASTAGGARRRSTPGCCPGSAAPSPSKRDASVEGSVTIEEARSAEEIALISDTRGWRRAVLV